MVFFNKILVLVCLFLGEFFNTNCAEQPLIEHTILEHARMKAKEHFSSHKIHSFDGIAGTNQCHINALLIVLLAKGTVVIGDMDNFLTNTFLLNSGWLCIKNNTQRVCSMIDVLQLNESANLAKIKMTMRGGSFILATRKHLNTVLQDFFFNTVALDLPENFRKMLPLDSKNGLPIIPKFLGITKFLEYLKARNDIWMILQCKVKSGEIVRMAITPDQKNFVCCDKLSISSTEPVIIIESESDLDKDDLLNFLMQVSPEKLQLAVAAEFNNVHQHESLELLKTIGMDIDYWIAFAGTHGLTKATPTSKFFILHMRPDTFENAIKAVSYLF